MDKLRQIWSLIFFLPINSLCKIFLEAFVPDRQIRAILKGKLAKLYLKKYIKKAGKNFENQEFSQENIPPSKTIWQFWEQGINQAPDIVKACINSVEQNKGSYRHVILSMENLAEYVELPQIFYDLKQKGIIKSAYFSDIVRTYLLAQNGGVWMDATLYLMRPIPDYILNTDIFVFQNSLKRDIDGLNMASYFIVSKPHNIILEHAKFVFEEYWKENRFLNNYFMFLHAFTMITQVNKKMKEYFSKVPFFSFMSVQVMQPELMREYSPERWEQYKDMSFVHKLSYKAYAITSKNNIENTFYSHIIKSY